MKEKTSKEESTSQQQQQQSNDSYRYNTSSMGYLSKKGYTIKKASLSMTQIKQIKAAMYMKPFVPFNPLGTQNGQKPQGYSIYRDTPDEIFLPRFYGEETFGVPQYSELEKGQRLSLENTTFVKPLHDYQEQIVAK